METNPGTYRTVSTAERTRHLVGTSKRFLNPLVAQCGTQLAEYCSHYLLSD
jgi:hypothetical protein